MGRKRRLGSDPLSWIMDSREEKYTEENDFSKDENLATDHTENNELLSEFDNIQEKTINDMEHDESESDNSPPQFEVDENDSQNEISTAVPENPIEMVNTIAENDVAREAKNDVAPSQPDLSSQENDTDAVDEPEEIVPQVAIKQVEHKIEPQRSSVNNEVEVPKITDHKQEANQGVTSTEKYRGGKYLTFILANEEYGIEILKVQEIIGLLPITPVPNVEEHICGVLNLRGNIISVIDLGLKFEMGEIKTTEETCIIVVMIKGLHVGIIVDKVSEVLDISEKEIEDTPTFGFGVTTDYIHGIGKKGDKVYILLDIDKVIVTQEMLKMQSNNG